MGRKLRDDDSGNGRRPRGRPRELRNQGEDNTIKSVDRALSVFESLSRYQSVSLSELAANTGQTPPTIYRILHTLEKRGFVDFDAEEQVWSIGPTAFTVGSRFLRRTTLVEKARPILRKLMQATGETANVGIERHGHVLYLTQVETDENIRAYFPQGTLSPLHVSGIGKVILSYMDKEQIRHWQGEHKLVSWTDNTITTVEELHAELEEVRKRGFAMDDEENSYGMRCFAAPVFDNSGEVVAGISVSGPTSRIKREAITALSNSVIDAANQLTIAIGGNPQPP